LMVVSVVVGFLNMSISSCWAFRMKCRSRKLTWLLASSVGESCMLLCMELACRVMVSGLVRLASYIIIMSSTYWQ
jgi:hypothetical protein